MSLRCIQWKTVAVLAAVLAVGVIASCLFVGKMRERKPFVSKVVAGSRFRCTLSSDWKLTQDFSNVPYGLLEGYTFTTSPSPIREWLAAHLFHQPPAVGSFSSGRPQLMLATQTTQSETIPVKIQGGYPEPDFGPSGAREITSLTAKHLRIDGCPATLTRIELVGGSKTFRSTILLVCTPDCANVYIVGGGGVLPYSDQADREVQAVLSSFHVEKVAAALGAKR